MDNGYQAALLKTDSNSNYYHFVIVSQFYHFFCTAGLLFYLTSSASLLVIRPFRAKSPLNDKSMLFFCIIILNGDQKNIDTYNYQS